MLFESDDFPMEERGKHIDESEYPYVIKDIMFHIYNVKLKDKTANTIDIIMDYAFKNKLDPSMVGDIISSDKYFVSFVKKNL